MKALKLLAGVIFLGSMVSIARKSSGVDEIIGAKKAEAEVEQAKQLGYEEAINQWLASEREGSETRVQPRKKTVDTRGPINWREDRRAFSSAGEASCAWIQVQTGARSIWTKRCDRPQDADINRALEAGLAKLDSAKPMAR